MIFLKDREQAQGQAHQQEQRAPRCSSWQPSPPNFSKFQMKSKSQESRQRQQSEFPLLGLVSSWLVEG